MIENNPVLSAASVFFGRAIMARWAPWATPPKP